MIKVITQFWGLLNLITYHAAHLVWSIVKSFFTWRFWYPVIIVFILSSGFALDHIITIEPWWLDFALIIPVYFLAFELTHRALYNPSKGRLDKLAEDMSNATTTAVRYIAYENKLDDSKVIEQYTFAFEQAMKLIQLEEAGVDLTKLAEEAGVDLTKLAEEAEKRLKQDTNENPPKST